MQSIKPKSVALFVGAGAVENAWTPVSRALQQYYKPKMDADGCNMTLSQLVFNLRFFSNKKHREPYQEEHLQALKKQLVLFRNSIAYELQQAQRENEISARPELPEILEKFAIYKNKKFMFVSTNWDTVIDNAIRKYCHNKFPNKEINLFPLHVHGSIFSTDHLYLPTEVTHEPYRTEEEIENLSVINASIMKGLELCERVVIYGLSLSPLDAELGMILTAGLDNEKLQEIIVVDPMHEQIAKRVNVLLTHKRKIIVKGCNPNNLNKFHYYNAESR